MALTCAWTASPASAQSPGRALTETTRPLELYVAARAASLLGEPDVSAEYYAKWLRAAPSPDSSMETRAASAAIAAGRFDLARAIAADSSAPGEFALDLRLLLLADALRGERCGQALEILVDEQARIGLDFIEPFVRGWIDAETRKGDYAIRAARRLAALPEDRALARQQSEHAAHLFLMAGVIEPAGPLVDTALSRAGIRELPLRLAFADRYAALGRPDLAASLLAGEDPTLADARIRLAEGESLGLAILTPAQAFSELMMALALDVVASGAGGDMPVQLAQVARAAAPDSPSAALAAGAILANDSRSEDALALYATVPATSALAHRARDSRIQALLGAGRAAEAVRVSREALSADDSAAAWARLGDALSASERHAEAAIAYGHARGAGGNDWELLFLEAAAYHQAGDWPAARPLFQGALALAPDDPLVLNYLGYAMLEAGEDTALASAYIRKAASLSPDSAAITDSLGWALYKLGDLAGAVEALERASMLAPSDPDVLEHHGDALYAAGRRIDARHAWHAAIVYAETETMTGRLEDKILYGLGPANAAP